MKKLCVCFVLLFVCFVCFASDVIKLNNLDSKFMKSYNEQFDKIGSGLTYASLATPAILLQQPSDQYLTIGTMYAETIALTYGTKELMKHVIERNRPYTYFDNVPEKDKDEWKESFPSGHTALAFASAAFTSYVFCKSNPDSELKLPVVLSCGALAVATAAMRVQSGNHFPTDVLAGAAIGTLFGIVVPMLHTVNAKTEASPFGLFVSFGF